MKKNVWIYAAAGAVLAMTMAGSFILGTAMNFQGITFPVSLFIPFVVYIVMETYLCDKFGLRQLIFALSVIGGSFLALLLILFLSALLTRSFDILTGIGWIGFYILCAYGSVTGLRLFWILVQKIRGGIT